MFPCAEYGKRSAASKPCVPPLHDPVLLPVQSWASCAPAGAATAAMPYCLRSARARDVSAPYLLLPVGTRGVGAPALRVRVDGGLRDALDDGGGAELALLQQLHRQRAPAKLPVDAGLRGHHPSARGHAHGDVEVQRADARRDGYPRQALGRVGADDGVRRVAVARGDEEQQQGREQHRH